MPGVLGNNGFTKDTSAKREYLDELGRAYDVHLESLGAPFFRLPHVGPSNIPCSSLYIVARLTTVRPYYHTMVLLDGVCV